MRFSFAQPSTQSFGRRPEGSESSQGERPGPSPVLDGNRGPSAERRRPAAREAGPEPRARSGTLAPEPPDSADRSASDEIGERALPSGVGEERDGADTPGEDVR